MGNRWSQTSEPGDLIEIFRGDYQHWAVYVGGDDVVHVTSPPGAEGADKVSSSLRSVLTKEAMVRKQKLKEAVGDDRWRTNNILDMMFEARSPHIIVEKALMEVGKMIEYSITSNNCEHFATKMRYGKAVSIQGMVAGVVVAPFYPPGAVAVAEAAVELFRSPQTD